jgi:hypothetical protein
MKNLILIFISLFFVVNISHSQNSKVKKMLSEIEGKWEVDDSGNVTYTRIVEVDSVSKEELYLRALGYFTYNYNSGEDVIQVSDKESGTIIGKGLYSNIPVSSFMAFVGIETYHILRIDLKEGKARIILSLTDYRVRGYNASAVLVYNDVKISRAFPIKPNQTQKNAYGAAFYESHKRAINTLEGLEKALKEGNSTKKVDDDW